MDQIKKEIRRITLKPLTKKTRDSQDLKPFIEALRRLDGIALAQDNREQLNKILSKIRKNRKSLWWPDPVSAAELIKLVRTLYKAHQFTMQEYIFYAYFTIDRLNTQHVLNGDYDDELKPIERQIIKIEKYYGLKSNEYWPRGKGPIKYINLNRLYDAIIDRKLMEIFKEYKLSDLAKMKKQTPTKFDQFYERGRRYVIHNEEISPALRDIASRYEEDARRAAAVKAYSAAIISLGAGVEGLLLLRCLRSKQKACRLAKNIKGVKYPDDPTRWVFDTLIKICLQAKWFPKIETSRAQYSTATLADHLKSMRNYVHPGRKAREKPWIETEKRDYQDAHDIYITLLTTIGKVRGLRKIDNTYKINTNYI
ncbi:MAG: hypothetical protein ACYDHZ_10150 [Dehalococcoidia bacterium]